MHRSRLAAAFVLAAALLAVAWSRLEQGTPDLRDLAPLLVLAALPAFALAVTSRLRPRLRLVVVAAVAALATLLAAASAFGASLAGALPGSERDYFRPVLGHFRDGFLEYYDTVLPFDGGRFPYMHGVLLMAILGFVLAAGLLLAAGRPVGAAAVLLVGAGWPTTLDPGSRPLLGGAAVLGAILAILFLVRGGSRAGQALRVAVAAGVVIVAVAVGASTHDAVAKRAVVSWQGWDPYHAPDAPVGVRYVWASQYGGIHFPKKRTVVLRIKVSGDDHRRSLYWRATTLDDYTGTAWREARVLAPAIRTDEIDERRLDPFLPAAAGNPKNLVRQDVAVAALADDHLVGSAQPVRWRPDEDLGVRTAGDGVVVLPAGLRDHDRYTVWSYVPKPTPAELAAASSHYARWLGRYRELVPGYRLPAWGVTDRPARVRALFARGRQNFLVTSNAPLYDVARKVVGAARTPYAAAAALEAWFRRQGGFRYDEQPPQDYGAEPPLVHFVLRSRQGYCQHFAGAMAIMLRMLGVPARVAAGFTSGRYDEGSGEWMVTDHDAHAWVEVYFPGFGWLPFDPTPGRGELSAEYSSVSPAFLRGAAVAAGVFAGSSVLDAISSGKLLAGRAGVERAKGLTAREGTSGVATAGPAQDGSNAAFLVLAAAGVLLGAFVALKLARRLLRFAKRDARSLARAYRRDLVAYLADQGIDTPPGATLEEVGKLVEREFVVDAGAFVGALGRARYGPPEGSRPALRSARRELRAMLADVRRELGLRRRARGLFRLRSFAA